MVDCTGGIGPSQLAIQTSRLMKQRVEKSVSLQTSRLGQIPSRLIEAISQLGYWPSRLIQLSGPVFKSDSEFVSNPN